MSHSSSKDGFTPSARPSQPNAYVSPLNALSNQSGHPYATPSSNSVLTNKLIPRDYLTSISKSTPGTNGTSLRSPLLVSETGNIQPGSASNADSDTAIPQSSGRPRAGYGAASLRKGSGGASDEGDFGAGEDLMVERTKSPDSVAAADSSALSSKPAAAFSSARSLHNNMPRTSSIDSALSSVSASSQQRRDQGGPRDPSPTSIRALIATAGSAEGLVLHLLKEKNHAASQNNQLWTLVEKQRALLMGLNKDLERVTKDRDRYKKKLKELQSQGALPRAATHSPEQDLVRHRNGNAVQPPQPPHHDNGTTLSNADSASNDTSSPIDAPGPAITEAPAPGAETNTRRPTLQAQTMGLAQPSFALTEATPMSEKPSKGFSALRKTAPKPLNLLQNNNEPTSQTLNNVSDQVSRADNEDGELRGRRKTREDDDKDREKSLIKEQEARSKSKKKSQPPAESEGQTITVPPTVGGTLPASPRPQQALMPGNSLDAPQLGTVHERLIPMPLRSPGLPASPRPMVQNIAGLGALPSSPRAPPPGPLSPRAPKQPIPAPMMSPSPFTDPAIIQRQNQMARQAAQEAPQQQDRLQVHESQSSNEIPSVYQGLVSSQYPNLLLPPNALPSIQVKVASSRLRPSRHSMLGLRTQEDSTVFSLSVFSRASRNELWRIEKIPAVLPQMEQQLRPRCRDLPRLPDRKLFNGHSPAVIDARREAVDAYFEDLLDMEMDETSALLICRFLSTDVLDPSNEPAKHPGVNHESLPQSTSLSGKVVKTGFLTKRGKNFGGWKSRWFVLDSPELRYYETPGGPHLGTIKIQHARIGSQKPEEPASNDPDDQYRHAFLIQEPKKKDSTTYVRHILCAESDADRDQWVKALLRYVESYDIPEDESPTMSTNASFSSKPQASSVRDIKTTDTQSNASSPTSPVSFNDGSASDHMSKNTNISGPINGAPIQDSSQWGNRSTTQQVSKDKSKMGNIFHFKKGSQEQLSQNSRQVDSSNRPRVLRHNGYVRAVFGLPLADAVEYCSPFNIDVQLPAVVYRSIEYLRFCKAANEEGLFRLSGSNIVVKTLKERFNTEGDIDLIDDDEYYDVHAVASLFKTYLRELPSPLLTRDLHIEFLKVLELESQDEKVAAFNILVHHLPKANFALLRALSEYLLEVTDNAGKNKMSVRNMGIVFSPTVNIPTPVFNLFLSEFDAIFERQPGQAAPPPQVVQTELRAPASLSPGEIRSPRHQMFSDIPTPAYHQTSFQEQSSNASQPRPQGHQTSGSGEFGFIPVHPSYENGQYVSNPQEQPRTQAFAPPPSSMQQTQMQMQMEGEEQYGSLNRMVVPQGAGTDKRRKRESAMLF
ncbi:Rho GTPase activating protein [Knufia fluminis]|uniref:Rho GTPase activating protein n=1 Tax=Knufia fluminis TaxID=191047 RepID=A0AAN8F687_9EURO|nr:Rho GTPase activating protein [Knufia fluminis]